MFQLLYTFVRLYLSTTQKQTHMSFFSLCIKFHCVRPHFQSNTQRKRPLFFYVYTKNMAGGHAETNQQINDLEKK